MRAQSVHRVKFIGQIKTVHRTIRNVYVCVCVLLCGMLLWLMEVTWLNCTPETTRNNPCIVKRTLITSEYSKHPHWKASQNITLITWIDPVTMLWLLRWICSAGSWKYSMFCMWKQRIVHCWNPHTLVKIHPAADLAKCCWTFYVLLFYLSGLLIDQLISNFESSMKLFWVYATFLRTSYRQFTYTICHSSTHIVLSVHIHKRFTVTRLWKELHFRSILIIWMLFLSHYVCGTWKCKTTP